MDKQQTIEIEGKVFTQIPGYEKAYISEDAQVYSGLSKRLLVINYEKAKKNKNYVQVPLRNNGKSKTWYLHRLVALTFIPKHESKEELHVDHIDRDKYNNHKNNLRWSTRKENARNTKKQIKPYKRLEYVLEDLEDELWQEIVMNDEETGYYVSSEGRIANGKGQLLNPFEQSGGYLCVCIKRKTPRIHRLVAKAFLEPIEGKNEVDHLNRIRTDNRLVNLRWADKIDQANNNSRSRLRFRFDVELPYDIVSIHSL